MAKQIKSSDIFEGDIFENVRQSAIKTIEVLDKMNAEMKQTAQVMKKELGSLKLDSLSSIKELIKLTEKANQLNKESIAISKARQQAVTTKTRAELESLAIEKQKQQAQQEAIKTEREQLKLTRDLENAEKKKKAEQEKANKIVKDQNNAYKQLERNTRELKNQSKTLGAEMLKLEQSGKKNTEEYRKLSAQYKQVTASAQKGDAQLKKLDKTVGDNFRNVGNYQSALGGLKNVLGAFGIGFGVSQIKSFISESINLSRIQEKAVAQVNAGLESTGGVVGYTLDELKAKASAFQQETLFGDEQILTDLTSVMLTFTNVTGEAFDRAQQSALDLSTRMGGDLKGAAVQLGKALNDPIKGVTALSRVGVSFTEDQKEQIKALTESGQLYKAQTIILDEMNKEFGGSAKASALADGGITQLSNAIGDAREEFGKMVLEGLRPLIQNLKEFFSNLSSEDIRQFVNRIGSFFNIIIEGVKIFGIWKAVTYAQIVANKLLATSSQNALSSISSSFQKLGNFLKTNAVTIFVTAMVYGLMKIKSTLDDLNAPFERINDLNENLASISQRSSEKLGEEKAQLQLLVGQIKSHNAGSEERGKLLQQLNDKYGVHLKNISDETEANRQLDIAQRQIIANLKSQILLQARQEQYTEVIKAVAVAEDEFAKAIASNRAKINKLSDKEIDAWIKRLGGSKSFQEQIEKLSMAEKRRYLIEDNLSSEQLNKKIALEQLQQKELEFEEKLQKQMNANTQSVQQNSVSVNTNTGSTKKNTDSKKELRTELDKVNESLSKQNELLAQIDEIQARQTIDAKQQEIDIKLANDLKYVSESGEIQVDALEQLIEEKFQLEKTAIENQQKEKLALIEQGYVEESRKEREALIKKRDELLAQENLTTEAKKKILESYDKELEQIEMNDLQRNADFESEKVIIADETNQKIVQLEKQKSSEINDVNDKLIDAQIKYYDDLANKSKETNDKITESDKETAQRRKEYFQLATDYFIKQSEERIKQIDKEIARAEESSERLKQLAINGNINAKESLAEQERIINEANARKEKEQRRQQRLQLLNTAFSTYQSKVESGSVNPLAETIRDVSLLRAFIETIPAFESGTEDTGSNGRGVDGKGGFHAILHPNERVIPKSMNEKIGSLSNEQLTKLAMEYQNGTMIRSNDQIGSSLETAILINKLDELTETIKMKPETNIELGEITQSMMEVVKSTKKGNTTTYNRYKIRK